MIVLKNVDLRNGDKILLRGANMTIQDGKVTCLQGENGSGKTTLLYALAFMRSFDHVEMEWDHTHIDVCDEGLTTSIRRNQMALILQDNETLFEENTLLQNIMIAFAMQHSTYDELIVENLKTRVSLSFDGSAYPASLSGGERKKFALLLAMIKKPRCILCDEPSSSLDKKSAKQFLDVLKRVCYEEKIMVVIVSHDELILQEGDVVYEIVSHILHCKRGACEALDVTDNKVDYKKVSFPFFKTYETYRKRQQKEWLLLCVIAVILSFVAFSNPFLKAYEQEQIQTIDMYAKNEIFITNTSERTPNPTYLATTPSFTQEQYNILKEIDHIEAMYPYVQVAMEDEATWIINHKKHVLSYDIKPVFLPYYPGQKGFAEDGMIYISDALKTMLSLEKDADIKILNAIDGEDFEIKNYKILDATYINKYSDVQAIVYLPISMFDRFTQLQSPNSYMVYADAFQNSNDVASDISKWLTNVSVKYQYHDMGEILAYIETMKRVFLIIQGISIIMMIVVVISTNYRSLLDRYKEFLILKIHGLENKHLVVLLLYEQFRLLLYVTMVSALIGLGVKMLFGLLFPSQSFYLLSNMKFVVLYGVCCFTICMICNVTLAYRKQIFDRIRNE